MFVFYFIPNVFLFRNSPQIHIEWFNFCSSVELDFCAVMQLCQILQIAEIIQELRTSAPSESNRKQTGSRNLCVDVGWLVAIFVFICMVTVVKLCDHLYILALTIFSCNHSWINVDMSTAS